MSSTFAETVQALNANPELRDRVLAASTNEERATILKDAGLALPTQAEVDAAKADLAGVAGGGATTTDINYGTDGVNAASSACCAA